MSLAELQRGIRDAVVDGDGSIVAALRAGAGDPQTRLAIHRRHYETSLVTALLGRFPATGWLVGSSPLIDAASAFVRRHPPSAPCIAEYGAQFPVWLRESPVAARVPYLSEFAELDWHLGRLSVEVEHTTVPLDVLRRFSAEAVPDTAVHLQPGLHYLASSWPIDELVTFYVTSTAPDRLELSPTDVRLELRGARGTFRFKRLGPSEFAFRHALHSGQTLGQAAEQALAQHPEFDPALALASLFADGLVVSVMPTTTERTRV